MEYNSSTPLRVNSMDLSEQKALKQTQTSENKEDEEAPEPKQEEMPQIPILKPTKSRSHEEMVLKNLRVMTMEVIIH